MVEVYEKNISDDELRRIVYSILTAEESVVVSNDYATLRSSRIKLVDKLLHRIKALVKTTEIVHGGSVALSAKIYLPYIENIETTRVREERDNYRQLYNSSIGKIEALEKKLKYHTLPWYKKIWKRRSE